MSINRVSLTGNLGADSELRVTQKGTQVLSFPLGVSERVPTGDGGWGDRTNWIDCVLFGRRAEALAPYLTKGVKVAVDGRLRTSTYERDGRHAKSYEVRVDDVDLMQVRRKRQTPQAAADVYDGDIPL